MGKTNVLIEGGIFLINGLPVYSELADTSPSCRGLLLNSRMIQGVFDDNAEPSRFDRFGKSFSAEKNTDDLITALPEWYRYGMRAITVGFQGGGPCFTIDNRTIDNNPFGEDGLTLDVDYANRMDRLIRAADELGMVVIVNILYGAQAQRLKDSEAIENAVITAAKFLCENAYTNVLIEVANEYDVGDFKRIPYFADDTGICRLIALAREHSGGMYTGSSGMGGSISGTVCEASDYVLIHGNGCSRQRFYNLILEAKRLATSKPIMCNEDSQALGNMDVALKLGVSWGYYNNITKQEPPTDWGITDGEDRYFACRMANWLGIEVPAPKSDFMLQGVSDNITYDGKRWIRVASMYPEKVDYVDFYLNDEYIYTCYDEPFSLYFQDNWRQRGFVTRKGDIWTAKVFLRNDETVLLSETVTL